MIELVDSTGKLTSVSSCTATTAEILRNPKLPGEHKHALHETYLDTLIKKNILGKKPGFLGHLAALEVRAFVNSLSNINRKKFEKIVKAFELDKENMKYFSGEIWSGGGVRVVAGSGAGIILSCIALLTGMKLHSYYGSSAGALQAIGQALGTTNSRMLEATIEGPFISFYKNRSKYETWVNELMRNAYLFYQNKEPDSENKTIKGKHIKEAGVSFDVTVGELSGHRFPKNYLYPEKYYLLKVLEEKFGLNPDELPIAIALGATANLPGLFFEPVDPTFGNCSITDSAGQKHYLFDAGLDSRYKVPIDPNIVQVKKYQVSGEKPEIHLVIDYEPTSKDLIQKLIKQGAKQKKHKGNSVLLQLFIKTVDMIDSYVNDPPLERLRKHGLQRTYINVPCAAVNPFTKEIEMLETGSVNASEETRQTVIFSSIPTADFTDVEDSLLDQFTRNFVDKKYVDSEGQIGKSPYELILSDINSAIKISEDNVTGNLSQDMSRNICSAGKLIKNIPNRAASIFGF